MTPDTSPVRRRALYRACVAGQAPAEALPADLRARLVAELVHHGWTDVQIAAHTRMTTYTTARIRDSIGLEPNLKAATNTLTTYSAGGTQ